VYIWNLRFISASVLFQAIELGFEPVLYVSDNWLYELEESDRWLNWMRNEPPRYLTRLAKRGLKAPLASFGGRYRSDQLAHTHAQFASSYLRSRAIARGRCSPDSPVIHWGVNADLWHPPNTPASSRRLLFVGQIAPEKGVHTVIEAVRLLRTQFGFPGVEMTIAGDGVNPAYVERVRSMASHPNLAGSVRLIGKVDRSALPEIYRSHGVLVFASEWEEPFSITLLEGMASGLAVVATLTGGTPEALIPGANALEFPPGDALGCAECLGKLLESPGLVRSLGQAARTTVLAGFRFDDMVSRIEDDLATARPQRETI
jgi:glycosyltransferase involved in cell wall biosynthesis